MEKQKIEKLSLLLLYVTGWEEDSRKQPGKKIFRSWKGYLFEVLNKLESQKYITQFRKSKSVVLTEAGKRKAEEIKLILKEVL